MRQKIMSALCTVVILVSILVFVIGILAINNG